MMLCVLSWTDEDVDDIFFPEMNGERGSHRVSVFCRGMMCDRGIFFREMEPALGHI